MSKNLKGCFSHNTDDWRTPTDIYNAFMNKGYIDCFPYHSEFNELDHDYSCEHLFINPPYSKLNDISDWIIRQANDNFIALLIPARTDTKYFKKFSSIGCDIIFIHGRLKFNDSKLSAPFPSMLLLFGFNDRKRYYVMTKKELIETIEFDL